MASPFSIFTAEMLLILPTSLWLLLLLLPLLAGPEVTNTLRFFFSSAPPVPFSLSRRLSLLGFLGLEGGALWRKKSLCLKTLCMFVGGWDRSPGSGQRDSAATARLPRAEAPRAAAGTLLLRGLLEFLSAAAAVASRSPAEFLGSDAPLVDSDLLGRRRRVEIQGRLRAVVGGSFRLGRLDERGFGYRRSSSGGVSGAQRVSHLEASLYLLSSPSRRFFFFCSTCKAAEKRRGLICSKRGRG